jgi:hypothetical protein
MDRRGLLLASLTTALAAPLRASSRAIPLWSGDFRA